jgi:hypothetical protein
MASVEHQEQLASAVTNSVESFCKAQGPRKPQQRIARRQPEAAAASATPPFIFPFFFNEPPH